MASISLGDDISTTSSTAIVRASISGKYRSIQWEVVVGKPYTINGQGTPTLVLTGLTSGIYLVKATINYKTWWWTSSKSDTITIGVEVVGGGGGDTTSTTSSTTTSSTTTQPPFTTTTSSTTTKPATTSTSTSSTTSTSTTKAPTTSSTTTKAPSTGGILPNRNPDIYSGFETLPVTQGFNSYIQQPYDGKQGDFATLTNEITPFAGTKCLKIQFNKADGGSEKRVEMSHLEIDTITEGSERWYNFKWQPKQVSNNLHFIAQFHHDGSTGSPPLALAVQSGKFVIDFITSLGGSDQFAPKSNQKAFILGKWHDIIIHGRFSSTNGKALTEIYIDGELYYSSTVPNMFSGQTNYFKFGIYNWDYANSDKPAEIDYRDEFKMWK